MSSVGTQYRADLNALIEGLKSSGLASEEVESRVALMMMAVEMIGMVPAQLFDTLPCKGEDDSHDHSEVYEAVVLAFGLWVQMLVSQGKMSYEKMQELLHQANKIEVSVAGFKPSKTASA